MVLPEVSVESSCATGCPGFVRGPERLRAIIHTQTEIARQGLDLGSVMALVAERAQALTGAAGAVIEMAEGQDMVYRAACGIAADQLGLRLPRDTSLSGLCVAQNRPLQCEDSECDPRVNREACRKVGLRSMVVVPLMHGDITVGALKVVGAQPQAFGAHDVETLTLISGLAAASMFHAVRYGASELFHRATHDPLTGLPNRALFYDRLRQTMAQAQRARSQVALVNFDLDGLKVINDRWGHRAGDAAIREAAERLRRTLRATDTPARLGGDEFAVIMVPVDGSQGAQVASQRLARRIGAPFSFEDRALDLKTSVGVSVFPDDGADIERLVDLADQRMYADKRARRA